jgi:hypothetical protein
VYETVYEMKGLGRDAAELAALANHLTAHGLVLEMLAGPLPGIYGPTGPGKLLFAFFAAMTPEPAGPLQLHRLHSGRRCPAPTARPGCARAGRGRCG